MSHNDLAVFFRFKKDGNVAQGRFQVTHADNNYEVIVTAQTDNNLQVTRLLNFYYPECIHVDTVH